MDTDNENNIDSRLVALDLECSMGGYPSQWEGQGDIVSIGMVHLGTGEEYYQEVRWDDVYITPQAARIIAEGGIDITQLDQHGKRLDVVDSEARRWLEDVTGIRKQWRLHAVGFGVKHFDLPYMSRCRNPMTKTRNMFSVKAMELTDICQFMDICMGNGMGTLKKKIKKHVEGKHTHNALDDAKQAAEVFMYLQEHVNMEEFW